VFYLYEHRSQAKGEEHMISNMNDPAGPLVAIDYHILVLKKLLRPAGKSDTKAIIDTCESIRIELSQISDWAFQKGKQND